MEESLVLLSNPDIEMPDGSEDEYQVIEDYLYPDDMNTDNKESASHPESIMPATKQNTAASAETAVRFNLNPDSPLSRVGNKGNKRLKEWDDENEKRIHVRAIQLCDEFVC